VRPKSTEATPRRVRQAACSRAGITPRTGSARKGAPLQYYIRQQRKHVAGPFDLLVIQGWVKEGKVREEMEFSEDGHEWMLGIEMVELFGDRRTRPPSRPRRRKLRRI